ncbi:hypothetical protein EYZ11_010406 [Aspergillus tanneri]|uniref:Uncharacterized protein n=1 Tax=Aspergillus tanneri TaxID=1220188 RepID=A0A4S3J5G0_9EURO|nr:hypothetical protein EYZ11_010406 [Aspergillus tanneri]
MKEHGLKRGHLFAFDSLTFGAKDAMTTTLVLLIRREGTAKQ